MTTLQATEVTTVDFIQTAGIKAYVLPAHENPHRTVQDQNTAYHYSCKLINEKNNWFVVYFSKGPGIRLWKEAPEMFVSGGTPIHVSKDQIGTRYDGPIPPWTKKSTERDAEIFNTCSVPEPPVLAEILDCLANDCITIEASGSFETWCEKVGGNIDSRHAKRTWDAVLTQRGQLQSLLGMEQYHRLLYEINRPEPEISPEQAE